MNIYLVLVNSTGGHGASNNIIIVFHLFSVFHEERNFIGDGQCCDG